MPTAALLAPSPAVPNGWVGFSFIFPLGLIGVRENRDPTYQRLPSTPKHRLIIGHVVGTLPIRDRSNLTNVPPSLMHCTKDHTLACHTWLMKRLGYPLFHYLKNRRYSYLELNIQ